ncbi:LysR substrate-binding domain-containing protein [Streptomyces sp. cf386]|uniref:LysR substrate-binding domain-containing protein n=1 Tax=Streptomyces sp. cf386 TaxID=1761904 RepID=UPI00115F789D|nr:LysR substrate-binding domain-containing protein [Streptomyces sp. cf386]
MTRTERMPADALAEEELASLNSPSGGRVRLAAMQSSCVSLVPRALGALRRTHPELEVTVTQAECPVSHGLLLNGEIELAVMCDVDAVDPAVEPETGRESLTIDIDPRLSRIPLLTDRRCVLLPADHPAAAQPFVSLADLAEERWVLESGRARFLAACREAGFTPRIAATVDDQLTLHHLVAHRIGLAVLNTLAVTAHTDPRVVTRPLTGFPVRHVFALLWPDARNIPAAALLRALSDATRPTADGVPGILPSAAAGQT